jgi:hypothetical protein
MAHELSAGSSHTPTPLVSMQRSLWEQSREAAHCWWQRLKAQTSGSLQSELMEHPSARPSGDFDELLQLGVPMATRTATGAETRAHATTRSFMEDLP